MWNGDRPSPPQPSEIVFQQLLCSLPSWGTYAFCCQWLCESLFRSSPPQKPMHCIPSPLIVCHCRLEHATVCPSPTSSISSSITTLSNFNLFTLNLFTRFRSQRPPFWLHQHRFEFGTESCSFKNSYLSVCMLVTRGSIQTSSIKCSSVGNLNSLLYKADLDFFVRNHYPCVVLLVGSRVGFMRGVTCMQTGTLGRLTAMFWPRLLGRRGGQERWQRKSSRTSRRPGMSKGLTYCPTSDRIFFHKESWFSCNFVLLCFQFM